MNEQQIQEVESHKHLGLIFSKDGSLHDHINSIANKAWGRINVMRKLTIVLDRKTLQIIYYTFIRPILEYSDVVWACSTQYETNELDKIQLDTARIVTGTTKLFTSLSLYRELGWESLGSRRRKHKLLLFYKMINGLCPDHPDQLIPTQVSHASSYNLWNSEDYLTVRTNTQLYYNSFLRSVVGEWNSLPEWSRNAATLESFKMSLNMDTVNKPPYYYIGERLGQIYHVRLRTQCSSLNEHLFRKSITTGPQLRMWSSRNHKTFYFRV